TKCKERDAVKKGMLSKEKMVLDDREDAQHCQSLCSGSSADDQPPPRDCTGLQPQYH
ncbi:hypothetical protein HispidOSU_003132, partial [Sigmodon hispidus]